MSGSIDMRGGMGMMDGYGSGSYDQKETLSTPPPSVTRI